MGSPSPADRAGAQMQGQPPGRRRSRRLARAVSSAPLSVAYTLLLLITTAVLRHVSPGVTHHLLVASSTDVAHLGRDPAPVLVLSALWLPGQLWLPYALVLLFVSAPLERRIGTGSTALIFGSGHVLATLLTELPIAAAISVGWLAPASGHRIDVGASYGMLAIVTAFVGSLSRPHGLLVLVLAGVLVAGIPTGVLDMTVYGHLLAGLIGVCWWPRLYGRVPWRRRHTPGTPSD